MMANVINKSLLTNNVAGSKAADINHKAIQDSIVSPDAIMFQINNPHDKVQNTKTLDQDGILTPHGDKPDINASSPLAVPQSPSDQASQPNQDVTESSDDQDSSVLRQETSTYQPDYGTIGFESDSPTGKYFSPLAPDGLDNIGLYENFNPLDPFPFKNVTFTDQIIHDQHLNRTPPINDKASPPVANPDSYTVTGDNPLHVNAASGVLNNDTDSNAAATSLQANLVSGAQHGTVTLNSDGSFDYTKTSGYVGKDSFTYKDTNNDGTSNTTTVTLDDKASPPVANPDSYTVTGNGNFHVNATSGVLTNDTDGNADATSLQANLVSGAQHGTVTLNSDGSFDYTKTSGYVGQDSFTYKDTNSDGTSNTTTVTLNDQQPALQADSYQVNVNQDSSINIDTQSDKNYPVGTTPMITQQPTYGTVTYDPVAKIFDYTPNPGYSGPDSFSYQENDGTTASNIGRVNINVNPVEYLISGYDNTIPHNSSTDLFSFDPTTGHVTSLGQSKIQYNDLGDNPVDNTLYAINVSNNHVVKVNGVDGSTTDVGSIINSNYNDLSGPTPNSGTFDGNGLYYQGASQIATVQINGVSQPTQIAFSTEPVGSDTAINKTTGDLYTIIPERDNFQHILDYSTTGGSITLISDKATSYAIDPQANNDVGGLLINGAGTDLYGVMNNSLGVPLSIVKFNIDTGTATVVGTINIGGTSGIDATSVTHAQTVSVIQTTDHTTTTG